MDYDPEQWDALFLIEFALTGSPGVESFVIYDSNGDARTLLRQPTPP